MATNSRPAYGRRLVPQVVDELARADPKRVYAAIPETTDMKDGYRDVTVVDLARCINFMAKWIENIFGRSSSFETITYIGFSDLKGPATLLGAIKAGYKLLITSPRNSPTVSRHLMEQTGSTKLLYGAELAPLIEPLQALAPSVAFEALPSLQEMLDSNPEHYPYKKTFEEARNDPIAVMHSSGSTGLPKPITITNGSIAAHDNDHNLPAPEGRTKADTTIFTLEGENRRMYLVLPFFHLGGFVFFIDHAILNNLTLVLGPPSIAPDAILLQDIARQQKLRGIMVVPALLEQLLQGPHGLDLLRGLEFVACAGAPLPGPVGDCVVQVVKLFNLIGSTEAFPLPELAKAPEDWIYHEFMPSLKHEMQLYDAQEGTYEMVIFSDESVKDRAPVYHNLPGINPFYTKDLFTRHPTKPKLYKYYGRRDDIIVLANGEKTNPIPFEQQVQGHPALKGVLLIGNGRTQSVLIVEPRDDLAVDIRAQLIEELWPRIKEANTHMAGPGRVARGMVICTSPDRPFARTGKGTIVRKLIEEAYSSEIEQLYMGAGKVSTSDTTILKTNSRDVYESANIIEFLRKVLAPSFPPATTIGEDQDFYAYGLDSVQTLGAAANMKRNIQLLMSSSVTWIQPRVLFQHSTLADLSEVLGCFLNDDIVPPADPSVSRARALDEVVARHVQGLPTRLATTSTTFGSVCTVALIGSTGYIGSHLVATLLKDSAVFHIYCFNRGSDAPQRQKALLSKTNSDLQSLESKITFFTVELGAPRLGLDEENYDRLASEVDVVVYNSWRLDFGLALHSFDPFLRAARDLVELSVASSRNTRIVFISSISSVMGLASSGEAPEALVENSEAATTTGYGQSKLAAERILSVAGQQSGVPVSIVRVGQAGGSSASPTSDWQDQPWISAIITTSKNLGVIPSPVTPVDWIPINVIAEVLKSAILQPAQIEPQFYNVVSEPQPWSLLAELISKSLGIPEVTSLPDWVARLRKISEPTADDLLRLPALRLLDFYEGLGSGTDALTFATERTKAVSRLPLGPLTKELLESWLKGWKL